MQLAAGEPPEQEAVDRARGDPSLLCRLARSFHIVEQPKDLGGGEVRIQKKSGSRGDGRLMTLAPQARACLRRAPVLPYDRIVQRTARRAIPEHDGFALVGNADCRDFAGSRRKLLQYIPGGRQHA